LEQRNETRREKALLLKSNIFIDKALNIKNRKCYSFYGPVKLHVTGFFLKFIRDAVLTFRDSVNILIVRYF